MLLNPGWKSFKEIIKYNLEVVIHNCRLLDFYVSKGKDVNIHLKFNTGMNRYGFDKKDLSFVIDRLKNNSNLNVKSICSHLSSVAIPTKLDVSRNQISLFNDISKTIEDNLNKKMERHILNSNGFMNFQKSPDEYGKIRDFFIW